MLPVAVLERLANGEPQPRARLAASLGLSEDLLDDRLAELVGVGLELRETGGSVRLARAIDWIDGASVEAALSDAARARIDRIERQLVLDSTNRYLLEAQVPPAGKASVAIAEFQSGGRGRRGRQWQMPPGAGIALSAAWSFGRTPDALPALSLAMGAAARRALRDAAALEVGLKWPNDLIYAGRKLGGILIEIGSIGDGLCHVVAGIGVNYAVPEPYLAEVASWRHGAIDLSSAMAPRAVSRSIVAACLIERIVELLAGFEQSGFAPYRGEWLNAHVLDGVAIELETPHGIACGTVRGIDADGSLLVENAAGERQRFLSGDVTVRPSR